MNEKAKEDAKFSADGGINKGTDKSLSPNIPMPEKKEKDSGGGFDLFGDFFGGGDEKSKGKAKGKAGKMGKMGTFAKVGGGLLETAGSALWKAKGGIGSLAGGLVLDYGSEKLDETGHDTLAKIARVGSSALTGAGMGGMAGIS